MEHLNLIILGIVFNVIMLQGMEKKDLSTVPLHPRLSALGTLIKQPGNFKQRPTIQLIGPNHETLKKQKILFTNGFCSFADIQHNINNRHFNKSTFAPKKSTGILAALCCCCIPQQDTFETTKPLIRYLTIDGYTRKTIEPFNRTAKESWYVKGTKYSLEYEPIYLVLGLINHNVQKAAHIVDLVSDKSFREHDEVLKQTLKLINEGQSHLLQVPYSAELKTKILNYYNHSTKKSETESIRLRKAAHWALEDQREIMIEKEIKYNETKVKTGKLVNV